MTRTRTRPPPDSACASSRCAPHRPPRGAAPAPRYPETVPSTRSPADRDRAGGLPVARSPMSLSAPEARQRKTATPTGETRAPLPRRLGGRWRCRRCWSYSTSCHCCLAGGSSPPLCPPPGVRWWAPRPRATARHWSPAAARNARGWSLGAASAHRSPPSPDFAAVR